MKPIKRLIVLALLLAPGVVFAQGYYGGPGGGPPPVPGGFHNRAGRLAWGFSLGLGYMHDNGSDVTCAGCSAQPVTGEIDGHIGGMLSPRFALLFEVQGNVQQVALDANNDATLSQGLAMVAAQYWLTPQLWIKGGIGAAHLDFNDNISGTSSAVADGLGLMGAVGFELLSARFFALDLQGRVVNGSYHGTGDDITSGTIGLGLNWY